MIGPAEGLLEDVILVIAIAFGTINVVGGFLVTDRMLEMFKKREPKKVAAEAEAAEEPAKLARWRSRCRTRT